MASKLEDNVSDNAMLYRLINGLHRALREKVQYGRPTTLKDAKEAEDNFEALTEWGAPAVPIFNKPSFTNPRRPFNDRPRQNDDNSQRPPAQTTPSPSPTTTSPATPPARKEVINFEIDECNQEDRTSTPCVADPGREWRATRTRKPRQCYICEGPHTARDCPERSKTTALVDGNRRRNSPLGSP